MLETMQRRGFLELAEEIPSVRELKDRRRKKSRDYVTILTLQKKSQVLGN